MKSAVGASVSASVRDTVTAAMVRHLRRPEQGEEQQEDEERPWLAVQVREEVERLNVIAMRIL